jgi:hypothetical protein
MMVSDDETDMEQLSQEELLDALRQESCNLSLMVRSDLERTLSFPSTRDIRPNLISGAPGVEVDDELTVTNSLCL